MAKDKNFVDRWVIRLALPLALVAFHTIGHCGDDLVTSQLVDEARVWQSKGRPDLASNVWRRILVTSPQHAEALTSLGIIEAKAGRLEEAQALYLRARRVVKNSPNLSRLEAMVNPPGSTIESAGKTTRAGFASSSQENTPLSIDAKPAKPEVNSASLDPKRMVEKSVPKAATLPPTREVRTATAPQVRSMAQTPVPPPSTEVRVTPLPLPQISGNRIAATSDTDATDDIGLKASSTLKNSPPPPVSLPAIGGQSTTNAKRPKPCRLPLASASITS